MELKHVFFGLFLFFMSTTTTAEYRFLSPIKTNDIMSKWFLETDVYNHQDLTSLVECRQLRPLKSTWMCKFPGIWYQDFALARAALWVEGNFGHKPKTLPKQDSQLLLNYSAEGHNRRSSDLGEFFNSSFEQCSEWSPASCPNDQEIEFFERFFLLTIKNGPFYLITSFSGSSKYVIPHEVMHAHYYEDLEYKKLVNDFFNTKLSKIDRASIKAYLRYEKSSFGYYGCPNHVIIDEFQAVAFTKPIEDLDPQIQGYAKELGNYLREHNYNLPKYF